MITIKNVEVFNFEGALRGMRNPKESWRRSDSYFGIIDEYSEALNNVAYDWCNYENEIRKTQDLELMEEQSDKWFKVEDQYADWLIRNGIIQTSESDDHFMAAFIGPNDLKLAQKLILAGNEHAKFMRQILISFDITAPLYWWKEFDTYKIGTTANSTSTMHKLTSKPFTFDMFSFDKENYNIEVSKTEIDKTNGYPTNLILTVEDCYYDIINNCNILRQKYLETKDKRYWRALVQILPEGWNQTRTVTMSYANLRNIYFQRRNHKLEEWHQFCEWLETLPYGKELICLER